MKKQITILILLIISSYVAIYAQKPKWADSYQRQMLYPKSEYLTGFFSEINSQNKPPEELLNKLLESAKRELIEQIQVSIENKVVLATDIINTKTHEVFKQASVSFSKASITGMITDKYYDYSQKEAYVFVYAKKSELISYYQHLVINCKLEIEQKINNAQQYVKLNDRKLALKTFRECYLLFEKYKQDQSILLMLDNISTIDVMGISEYEIQVNSCIKKLLQSEQLTLDDVCTFMADELKKSVEEINGIIGIENFTFEETKTISEFSRRFAAIFPSKLMEEGFHIATSNPILTDSSLKKTYDYTISGTFWFEGNKHLKIIANLKNLQDGKLLAGVEGFLPISWLSNEHIAVEPSKTVALNDKIKALAKNENAGGGILVDLYTNKGFDNLLFTEGDTLKIFVKANHECYLRFIYYQADGKIVLFKDNFYISPEQINELTLISAGTNINFICSPPFGVEILQMNAQTEKFKPLNTKIIDGFEYVLDDVNQILANNRNRKQIDEHNLNAEKRIIFTTMAK